MTITKQGVQNLLFCLGGYVSLPALLSVMPG